VLYAITILIKPIFYLTLYVGLIVDSRLRDSSFFMLVVIMAIFCGLPIKEYTDFFNIRVLNELFDGKEYILSEYCFCHFIVNIIIENLPLTFLVLINNLMLTNKGSQLIYTPLIVNGVFILLHIIIISVFNLRKKFLL
jgi:hypothetical protein